MDDYSRKGTWLYLPLEDLSVGQVGILDFRHGSFVVGMEEDEDTRWLEKSSLSGRATTGCHQDLRSAIVNLVIDYTLK